jgi:hypothetical protein
LTAARSLDQFHLNVQFTIVGEAEIDVDGAALVAAARVGAERWFRRRARQ